MNIKKNIEVYEVLRIIEGKPLFLEEHYKRFINSIVGISNRIEIFSKLNYDRLIAESIIKEKIKNGNVKITAAVDEKYSIISLSCMKIPHKYPNDFDYNNGIITASLKAERKNPKVKVFNKSLREHADEMIKKNNIYEVILINSKNEVTEGSRSNLLFFKNNTVVSPPSDQILSGITRDKIKGIIFANPEIHYLEKPIKKSDLSGFDAACILGTSPKVLPINRVDDITYNAENNQLRHLINMFDKCISEYISTSDFNIRFNYCI